MRHLGEERAQTGTLVAQPITSAQAGEWGDVRVDKAVADGPLLSEAQKSSARARLPGYKAAPQAVQRR